MAAIKNLVRQADFKKRIEESERMKEEQILASYMDPSKKMSNEELHCLMNLMSLNHKPTTIAPQKDGNLSS